MTAETFCATGSPVELTCGGARVLIAPLGAGLRLYERFGVALVETYGSEATAPGATGLLLAPWGNRVRDGQWQLDGETQQLDLTEVSRNNASHGLLRNTYYRVAEQSPSAVTLEAEIAPQHGFPFRMTHTARYELTDEGHLTVEQTLTNHSPRTAPAALGAHPYLRLGAQDPSELTLSLRAQTRVVTDERLLPVGKEPVAGEYDLSQRRIAGFSLDCAYMDLDVTGPQPGESADRVVRAALTDDDGQRVTLWGDASTVSCLHVFVTDGLSGQEKSVAVEPMTAPADAFNSGDGLVWLAQGESLKMRWGMTSSLHPAS